MTRAQMNAAERAQDAALRHGLLIGVLVLIALVVVAYGLAMLLSWAHRRVDQAATDSYMARRWDWSDDPDDYR